MPDRAHRGDLQDWLTHKLQPMFAGRVLAVDEDVLVKWQVLAAEGRRIRRSFSGPDLIIAATASLHGLTVVMRNATDFATAQGPVFNPWVDPSPAGH